MEADLITCPIATHKGLLILVKADSATDPTTAVRSKIMKMITETEVDRKAIGKTSEEMTMTMLPSMVDARVVANPTEKEAATKEGQT